jgi:divalent metal cation (Fe/Co/Zn/Cd) transporter
VRWLARRKITIAEKIGSRALRVDAVEAVTCGWLSFVVVATLVAQWLFGAWWIDGVGSLAIVWFLVKEGRRLGQAKPAKRAADRSKGKAKEWR